MAGGSGCSAAPAAPSDSGAAMAALLRRVLEALEGLLLLRGRGEAAETGPLPATKHADLLESFRFNVAVLEAKLAEDPQWDELRRLRVALLERAPWLSPCPDVPWRFTSHALLLLLCLKQCMVLLAAAYRPPPPNPKTAEAAPPLSPDTLSVAQEKTVAAALQFVVTLGLCPHLLPGVGLPLRRRTEFSALVRDLVSPGCHPGAAHRLYATCSVLLEISQHPSLGSLVLTRHLGDLLAGLCQLGFGPARRKSEQVTGLTEEERAGCREALRGLLGRVYQPLVVRELLLLQGGPKQSSCSSGGDGEQSLAPAPAWLRRLCGQLLSEKLVRPGGVQAVVRGILEGAGAGAVGSSGAESAADWQKWNTVARILSSCPQQSLSLEDYYQKVCPQVLQLLLVQDKLAACPFQQVATRTVLAVAKQHPQEAERYLLRPLLEPLLRCLDVAGVSLEDLPAGTVLVKEEELSGCVESVFKVYVVGNEPSAVLLDSLQPVLGAIFSLCCFTKQNVSFLRTPCQEILAWFLEKCERETALSVLEGLARLGGATRFLHPLCQFQVASGGGVMVTVKEAVRDEDEALYQKISSEQWQLEQLVGLASGSQNSGLAGDFFLRCLKELTRVAGRGASEDVESAPLSCRTPTDPEPSLCPRLEQQDKQLRVLHLVAAMCEGASGTLFADVTQIVGFVAVTLQRACANLACSSETTVEAQTLSMAMGLVAAMLAGAVQLKPPDFAVLKQLEPLLGEVSRLHPEPVIQELADDLRITLSTRGAFSPETVCSAAQSTLGKRGTGGSGKARSGRSHVPTQRPRDETPEPSVAQPQARAESRSAADPGSTAPGRRLARQPVAERDLQELLLSACDPEIPARAAALRTLSCLIERRDPEALRIQEKLLKVFVENLEHEDSFVYLSAIQGVALLSEAFPEQVLPHLLAQYGGAQLGTREVQTVETRMKVGEALMRTTRALGDAALFLHRDNLIQAFLRGARDPESTLRASSLSNLGELCQVLRFQLGSVLHEVTLCLTAIAQTDREAEVRRAAVHVVVLLLRGLSERATEVLQDVLLDLYRLLKTVVRCERDDVTVLHAQLALEELDTIVRQFLFPQQSLEKKIVVLP